MSDYYSSGPNISGLIPKLTTDYPEDDRATVAEETAPPSYSSNGNLAGRSQLLLFPALGQRQFEADDQPPEVIREFAQSNTNLNNAKGISVWDYGTGGSQSDLRPLNRSAQGSALNPIYGAGAAELDQFNPREGSNKNLSSSVNTRIGPPNASHSQTGIAFMAAYNQFHHHQLPVVQESSDQS